MPSEPVWLPPEEIIELNRDLVEQTGEPFILRDHGLLESACSRPKNLWAYEGEEDAVVLATALLFGIAQNHVFMQGNKRTGFVAALMMLQANGWTLSPAKDSVELADAVLLVLRNGATERDFAEYLRPHIVPFSQPK